ncbi:MAG TPA: choice-of-anchor L domain-containing protein [Pirellulales bacterium]|nr:choice-of-anchor L domain-containing protein [Pirellulales bacterium]
MWRSLHPFKSEGPTKRKRTATTARKAQGRAAAEARKALSRRALIERFEERAMLSGSPELISIVANSGDVVYSSSASGQVAVLHTSPSELDLYFNQGTVLDPTTLGGIQVVGAGLDGKLNDADDVSLHPGYVGIGTTPNEVVLRFAQTLSDGLYQMTLLGSGPNALTDSSSPPDPFNSGNPAQPNLQVPFTVAAGPQVTAVVPEPIVYNSTTGQLQQNTSEIDVYFSKPIQTLAQSVNQLDPRLFQLIVTNDTASTVNQGSYNPTSVSFDPSTNKATLLFQAPLDALAGGSGALRLRIGDNQQVVTSFTTGQQVNTQPVTTVIPEPGSTFGNPSQPTLQPYSVNLESTQQMQHQIIDTVLGATNINPDVAVLGGNTGVGVRNDQVQQHIDYSESPLGQGAFAAAPTPGSIPTYTYNFPAIYGGTAVSPLHNVITSQQENLAREIFQLWSTYLGVQFREVSSETLGAADFGIVTGEVQAVNPTAAATLQAIAGPAPTSPLTINGVPEYLAVMNAQVYANESLYGGPWFTAAMQQIGRLLGLGFDGEGPPGTVMGLGGKDPATNAAPEPVFPGNTDILHGQSIYQPASDNVDMYSFTLHSSGQFSAQTIGQQGFFNVITIPSGTSTGAVGSAVADGSTFSINDGTQTVTFEFAANGRIVNDGNLPIAYNSSDSALTVAAKVAAAVNGAASSLGLKATAGASENQVGLSGNLTVTPSASTLNVITVPSTSSTVGTRVVDGSTFTISDGTHSVTFEFAANGRSVTDGNVPIAYNTTDSATTVATDIASAVSAAAVTTGLKATVGVYQNQVDVTGPVSVTQSPAYFSSITVPSVSGTVGTGVADGSTFTLSNGTQSVTFEFAANGRSVTDGNVPIAYSTTDSAQTVATDIANAITVAAAQQGLQVVVGVKGNVVNVSGSVSLTPSGNQGQVSYSQQAGQVVYGQQSNQIGYAQQPSQLNTVLTLYSQTNVIQVPENASSPAGAVGSTVVDGSTFTIDDGVHPPVTFEFAANGRTLTDGNVPIAFSSSQDSAHNVALEIANAINSAAAQTGLDVTASVQFDQVVLNGPVTLTESTLQGGVTYTVSRQIVSRNDDYFGTDSYLNMNLAPGIYYLAVTSTGNTQFNPNVANSGSGGTTQGPYELDLNYTPAATSTLTDLAGNPLLGNSNGTSGGAYNFWFNVGNTIFVDKTPPSLTSGAPGSLTNPYTNIATALQVAANRLIAPGGTTPNLDGQTFVVNDGQNAPVTFEFAADGRQVTDGNVAVNFNSGNVLGTPADTPTQVAQDIATAIQAEVNLSALSFTVAPVTNGNVVDVQGASFVDAKGSPALMASPKIVRILGNGTADNSLGVPATAPNGASITAGQIVAPAQSFTITAGTVTSTFEFFNGDAIEVSAASGANIADRSTFSITQAGKSVTFEFAANGRVVTDGNFAIAYQTADSKSTLAKEIAQAISAAAAAGKFGTNSPISGAYSGIGPDGNAIVSIGSSPAVGNTPATSYSVNVSGLVLKTSTNKMSIAAGDIAVRYTNSDTPAQLAQEIAAAINASPLAQPAGGDVAASVTTNAVAYTNGAAWFINLTGVGQLVINAQNASQQTGGGGTVTALGLIASSNAQPYEIGTSQFGGTPLADGSSMNVPQNVTVMIDAGAVFKLEGANISVGVNSPNVDRSQSALQVLGTPNSSVFFTSFHDNSIGTVTDTVTAANAGDWGGIVFGSAADMESQGIFLDDVNHARLSYAGGTVVVNGSAAEYAPIYLSGSRPTITNNTILNSRDSAISADPNSFTETVFGSPANSPAGLPSPIQTSPAVSSTGGTLATGSYYYVITALTASGETTASGEVSAAVTGPTGEVTLSWFPVVGATGYKIYRGTASGAENVLAGIVSVGTTASFVDTGAVVATGQSPPVNQPFSIDYERAGPDISGNTLAVTQPGAITLTAAAGNLILAGETFQVTNPNTGTTSIFEFVNDLANRTIVSGQLLADGHYAVLFSPGVPASGSVAAVPPDTAAQVAAHIAGAIQAANIGVTATATTSSANVSISGASSVVPSTPSSFTAPAGASIVSGETFVVVNLATGAQSTFQFITTGQTVTTGDIAVTFTTVDSAATIASKMAAAINGASLNMLAIAAGSNVLLSGATDFRITTVTGAGISATAPQNLKLSTGSAVTDGSTFVINNPITGSSVTFQYHLATDTTSVASGNIAIVYSKTDTSLQLANETVAAINAAGLGVSAVAAPTTGTGVTTTNVFLIEVPRGKFASPLSVASTTVANTVNGLFIRTQDSITQAAETLSVNARWTATDIPYVLSDNLILQGNPGGNLDNIARMSARLDIDPGVTVKLNDARIETQVGANFIAEGTASQPIVFTSLHDNTYGGGGTFETDGVSPSSSSPLTLPAPGDWAGLYFAPTSIGSLDYAVISYGGGNSTVQGNSDSFNVIEIHQATVRIADSTIENNAKGLVTGSRGDLEGNDAAAIYVLGAQPAIVNNVFLDNEGATISVNANSLTSAIVPDWGRSTGPINRFTQFDNNDGPLVRLNKIGNTLSQVAINGMLVRSGTLDTRSVWDDTDIVHVVEGQIQVPNVDTQGGLMLESSPSASLVVKFSGTNAGLTATGTPLDITNRVGGSVQVLGTPNHPVILTALTDATAGAGLTPDGRTQYDTNNTGVVPNVAASGVPTFPPSGQQLAVTTTTTAATLVNGMLLRPLANGVTITGSSLVGQATQQGTYANGDGVPLEIPQKGVILTSGNANIPDQNTLPGFTGDLGTAGDPRLSALIGGTETFDANELTITFNVDPNSGIKSGSFEFQFGSEEYPDFVGSQFNDVLAGFINGDQTTNFIHDSNGNLVTINSAFFNIDNSVDPTTGKSPYNIEYNGLTSGLVASFPVQPGTNTLTIAIADASDTFLDSGVLMTDLHFSTQDVGAGGVTAGGASAGAWQGLTFNQYSNDNNVAVVNEKEPAYNGGVDTNGTPSTSQPLGQLAANLTSGDDNQRLGFLVNGTISPDHPGDADVYSFQAQPGTQVWMAMGNTSPSLDGVLELVDSNGTVLARSDSAANEALDPSLLTSASPSGMGFAGNLAQPFASGPLLGGYNSSNPSLSHTLYGPGSVNDPGQQDLYSTNPNDPGFRVVLPVPPGYSGSGPAQYFVRVRSASPNINNVHGGQSSGVYQVSIALQQAPLPAGSSVQYADIRYATNGITVQGLPAHSPLVANAGETTNGTSSTDASSANQPSLIGTAQNLGNVLASDQNSVSVSGSLAPSASNPNLSTQVDWYQFSVNYNLVQLLQGSTAADRTFAAMFDIDYASGLQRADTTISVYNSSGTLIYVGRNSGVADDQPAPNSTSPLSNLTAGSLGNLDPFIGTVQIPAGEQGGTSETYYVAISSSAALPQALDGTFSANSANALVRLEPIDSVNRIVEDHVGSQGGQTAQSASTLTSMFNGSVDTTASNFDPTKPILATSQQAQQIASLNTSAVPWTLGNVQLFVDQEPLANTQLPTPANPTAGELFSINLPDTRAATALRTDIGPLQGNNNFGYQAMAIRNDGLLYGFTFGRTDATAGTYNQINTGTAAATAAGADNLATSQNGANNTVVPQNVGVQIRTMAYVQNGTSRTLFAIGSYVGGNGAAAFQNGLYELDPNTGAVISPPDTRNPNAGTSFLPVLLNPTGVSLSEQITGLASIGNTLYAVTNQGGLYIVNNPASTGASVQFVGQIKAGNGSVVPFTGLTNGPPDVNNGAYANDLFGVDANGNLYAFSTSGALQNVFNGGTASSVSLGVTNIVSLAFSTLDYNLWHVTDARANDPGHGTDTAPDNSRDPNSANQPDAGNLSYYFGLENPNAPGVIDTAQANGTATTFQPGAANYATNPQVAGTWGTPNYTPNYNLPGGAMGSLATNSFSLANYNAADAPTLYFDYFLNTGMTNNSTAGWKSSARVLVSTDGGATWSEVATNDPTRSAYNLATDPLSSSLGVRQNSQKSELPGFDSASATTGATTQGGQTMVDPRQQVQQLFDSTGQWRQARVDLSNYAGQSNIMLRFDFSTSGSMNQNLVGDKFGNFTSNTRGQNNNHEGFYVDDITVGLAGRGEMVTGDTANTTYFTVPQSPNANAPTQNFGGSGPYQLDIRQGTPYAVSVSPTLPDISLVNSFDVNDRLTDGFTISAPAGSAITDGATFQISDNSQHTVTFQFHLTNGKPVPNGVVAVPYQTTSTAPQVAAAIAAAVNANTTLKGVGAGTIQNTINGVQTVTANRVDLFGVSNLTSSQALVGTLTVSLGTQVLTEGASDTTTVTISRPTSTDANPVFVTVTATDVGGGASTNVQFVDANGNSLGTTITLLIPAGQASATARIEEVDKNLSGGNSLLADGPQKVQIKASAANYGSIAATVDVVDPASVVPTLTVTLNQPSNGVILENAGAGAALATVSRNTPSNVPLTVTLTSLDPASASVPATVVIPAGATSVTFPINAVDDNIKRTQPVTVAIVASAQNFVNGTTAVTVQDDGDSTQAPLGSPIWQPQGPAPIVGGQTTNTSSGPYTDPVVGEIKTVLTVPTNPNIIYVGTVNGGIWKTTNGTSADPTWTALTDNLPSLSIGAMQFDPGDPTFNTIIAGIGAFSSFNNAGGTLSGLIETTNGGQSWSVVTPSISSPATPVGLNISGVSERGNVIMAAANGASGGLLRSTDGGQTFTLSSGALTSGIPTGPVSSLIGDPLNSQVFYAAVLGQGIFMSNDGGATWSNVTPANLSAILNASPTGDNIQIADNGQAVYFGYEKFNSTTSQTQLVLIDRSPVVGISSTTWTAMDLPQTIENNSVFGLNPAGAGNLDFSIVADPSNVNLVYVGGDQQPGPINGVAFPNSVGATNYTGRLFRGDASKPLGSQWTPITNNDTANGSAPPADSRSLTIDSTGRLIDVDSGGIYALSSPSTTSGSWSSLVGNGLQISQFYSVAYDTLTNTIIAGGQDTGVDEQALPGWQILQIASNATGSTIAGQTFSVTQGTTSRNFQFVTATSAPVAPGNVGILLNTNDGPAQIAADIAAAIDGPAGFASATLASSNGAFVLVETTSPISTAGALLSASSTSSQGAVWNELGISAPGVSLVNGGDVAVDDSQVATTGHSIRYTSATHLADFQATTYNASNQPISFTNPQLLVNGSGGQTIYQFDSGLPAVTTVAINSVSGFSNQMVIGGGSAVYESFDDGQTLTVLRGTNGLPVGGSSGTFGAALVYGGMVGNVPNSSLLWVGVGTNVYLRTTAGAPLATTNYGGGAVVSLTVNPTNWQNAFVIDGNGHVWMTLNGGASYQDVTGNLTTGANALTSGLQSIAFVPAGSTNLIYVGAHDGVYQMQTSSLGVWTRYGAFMPNVGVYSLEYVPSQQLLVAGTLGRGVFTANALGGADDIAVSLNQQTVSDDSNAPLGGDTLTGTVTRNSTVGNQVVTLVSSDPALVPNTTVTIPDGQNSVNFSIQVNELTDSQGNEIAVPQETVFLTPQAAGLNPVSAFVNVTSSVAPQLTVTLSQNQLDPGQGVTSITGTVSRNTRSNEPLTVQLVSSDPLRASVPTTVTIPAGQESVTFTVSAVDQFINDSQPEWVAITAEATTSQGLSITSPNADGNNNQSFMVQVGATQHLLSYDRQGDSNVVPLQGQIILQDNTIENSLDYGIVISAGPRSAGGSLPYPGVPANYQPLNTDRVVPGVTVTSNLIVNNGQGGVQIVGDSNPAGEPLAVVPIARILNNTIYGGTSPSGTGVNVGANVSPTILNNIFANLATGVSVDTTSSSTVLEGSVYQNNGANLSGNVANGADLLSYSLASTAPLFTNAAGGDFYLALGSKAIDSAINQLSARQDLATAESLTGIAPSPTAAPTYDLNGQLRTADPQTTPNGVGSTLFKDRGAIERVDYTGPTAVLANPVDNGSQDQDPALNVVHMVSTGLSNLAIQLQDTGTGIDDSTITSSKFDLYRNGTLLAAGIDYFFQYDTNTKTVYFIPATGTWAPGNTYTVFVDNGVKFDAFSSATPVGIKDLAGNLLQANSSTGFTRYDILLQSPNGDAPTIGVPPLQTVPENGVTPTSLTFSSSATPANPITVFNIDAPNDTVTVTLQSAQGTLKLTNLLGLTNITGNGTSTLSFTGTVPAVNAALGGIPAQNGQPAVSGLIFTPTLDFRGTATISVGASDPLLGTNGLTGTGLVSINVTPVNQPPVITVPSQPFVTTENSSSPLIITGVSVSDPDYDPTVNNGLEQVTITVPNGSVILNTTTGLTFLQGTGNGSSMIFEGTLTNINHALNGLQFFPGNNFNGSTTISITVNDLGNSPGPAMSGTANVPITVTAVNQPPFALPIPTVTINETNQVGVTTTIDLRQYIGDPDENDSPPEAPPTVIVTGNTNPVLVTATLNGYTLTLTYTAYGRGSATISLRAIDNNSGPTHPTADTSVTVNVLPINYPPITANDEYLFTPGQSLVVDAAHGVLANDIDHDGNVVTAHVTEVPNHGQLFLNADGSFTYNPDVTNGVPFDGRDSFVYVAEDAFGHRVAATAYLDSLNSQWVARMYTEVLGRVSPPTDSEVNYWVGQLDAGVSRSQIAINFVTSPERRSQIINQLYEQYLGRPADASGLNYWLGVWAANQGPEMVQAGIIGSHEYYMTAGGTPQAWVTKLYQNLFNRVPDAGGLAYWSNYVTVNPGALSSVVLGFVTSDEYHRILLAGIPGDPNMPGWYEQFLHRPIDAVGENYWALQMDHGYPQETILEGILASQEYYNRS